LVDKRATQSISLRNTNVLVNHKHYRYIKTLWIELEKVKPEKSESEKLKFEQDVIKGLRAYAKALISYAVTNCLDYEAKGNYSLFNAEHLQLNDVTFNESNKGVFELNIGKKKINIVVIGNLPECEEKLYSLLEKRDTYLFYFDENKIIENDRLIHINPLDPDSVERVGSLLRKFILLGYLGDFKKQYKFKQLLKEYINHIPTQFLDFDVFKYEYRFHSYPKTILSLESIIEKIESDLIYKSKSRVEKENIVSCIKELYFEIEENASKLINEFLNCFNCGEKLHSYSVDRLDYLKCPSCFCLIDSSNLENVTLKIDNIRYTNLLLKDWGMDYLNLNMLEL
jgi:hypothetical protein